jgi:AcrR family transcriptional regulator
MHQRTGRSEDQQLLKRSEPDRSRLPAEGKETDMTQAPYRTKMRDSMVTIASRIVAEEGLGALQARRISQEAGCAVGTLYNVFGGLDFLIIEANARTLDALGETLAAADRAAAKGETADRLLALALAYLDFATKHSKAWRAVFEHHMSPGSDVPDWYRVRQGGLFGLVETILQPVIADAPERSSAARALFSAVHGIVTIALDRKLAEFDYAEAARQVRFVVRSVAMGLPTPSSSAPH